MKTEHQITYDKAAADRVDFRANLFMLVIVLASALLFFARFLH